MSNIFESMQYISDGIGRTDALKKYGIEVGNMSEREIAMTICDKAKEIAKEIKSGKDIMITKTASGIVIKKMTVQKV